METWKDIVNYEGIYMVSSLGNIKSMPKLKNGYKETIITKIVEKKDGYEVIGLYKNGIKKMKKVHRLVAEAFIPNTENKPLVNHKNAIKNDNRVVNLEWATNSENEIHALKNNLRKMPEPFFKNKKGIKSVKRKIRAVNSKEILYFDSLVDAMKYFKVSRNRIYFNCRKNREMFGYKFFYCE